MREPSLHIRKNDFKRVIKSVLKLEDSKTIDNVINKIFHESKVYSINRNIVVSNDKLEKNVKRLVSSSRIDTDKLSQLMYVVRKKMKHRGIHQIKPGDKEWGVLKEMTSHAINFCNEFNLQKRYGFLKYIQIGLSKIKVFNISKFLTLYESICDTYQAVIEIEKDDDTNLTKEMYNYYARRVIDYTGIKDVLEELPERYVWFVRARNQAKKLNVSIKLYMEAQFQELDFMDGIPYPSQFVGPKASDRVIRYCSKKKIRINNENRPN